MCQGGAESQVSGKPPSGFISTEIDASLLVSGKIWMWALFCLDPWVCLTKSLSSATRHSLLTGWGKVRSITAVRNNH